MAGKRMTVDEQVDRLAGLRSVDTLDAGSIQLLDEGLRSKSNVVAAKAAQVIGEKHGSAFDDRLIEAFFRFLDRDGDRGCLAKRAIAEALYEMEVSASEVFIRGAQHRQPEPGYGGPADAAAELRGICALGLVRSGDARSAAVIVDLLADPEPQVRIMAARAAGYTAYEPVGLLLRLKALVGDVEADVTAECLMQLMKLGPRENVSFVERFLDDASGSVRQGAQLAIGSWREPEGLALLVERWDRHPTSEQRRELAMAIATHRSEAAIDFLLDRLTHERVGTAAGVLEALSLHRQDEAVWKRVWQIVEEREEETLSRMFRRA